MTEVGRAHGVSLPLYFLLQTLEGFKIADASKRVALGIKALSLDVDVVSFIIIHKGHTAIGVESLSAFGRLILQEILARSQFEPCPEGSCEYDARGICAWCGTIPRQ